MRHLVTAFAALSLGLASIGAASAAKKATMSTSRYMAVEACTQQAQSQYPSTGAEFTDGRNRRFVYAACMRTKGFAP